ncbi:MAG TPA: ABC transporter ATP-binding protein [Candidatus Saccharimonadales bacterium]|nr:ABC transporter ATP-binding protein [Candidatus Saccharimonadales bacterium]
MLEVHKAVPAVALIELKNLTKTYRLGDETLHALDGVSIAVNAGEFVAITGPSGSGKTTLANIIGGLDWPTGGTVVVDGNDLSHVRDNKLSAYRNKYVGFVFQSFNLQGTQTALENVMLPLVFAKMRPKARLTRAIACLQAVGLGDRLRHRPSQLSGGQRQRVAIARALAVGPRIIIADEPTGNLDSQRGQEIMKLLQELNRRGITLLVITHDSTIARQAGRIVQIRDGRIAERRAAA